MHTKLGRNEQCFCESGKKDKKCHLKKESNHSKKTINKINIDTNTRRAFFIQMMFNEQVLSTGTAFYAKYNNEYLLFTNKHNVTGKNINTNELLSATGGVPNKIKILLPVTEKISNQHVGIGSFQYYTIDLYTNEKHNWIEHPNNKIDVVGIPFYPKELDTSFLVFDITEKSWHNWEIASQVNIIGYPYALSSDHFPIWITGYIATELNIDYEELPLFLIDARTRQGQSGSPVIATHKIGDIVEYKGKQYQSKKKQTELLGIYSGRINRESDLGRVWKAKVLCEIIKIKIELDKIKNKHSFNLKLQQM